MKQKTTPRAGVSRRGGFWIVKSELLYLLLLLIALPLVYFKNILDPVMMPRLFFLSLFLVVILLLNLKSRAISMNKWIVLSYGFYLLFVILSAFQAVNVKESLVDIVRTSILFFTLVYLIQVFQNERAVAIMPVLVNVVATLSIFMGLSSFPGSFNDADSVYLPDGRPWYYSISGLMAHKNQYAVSLMLMLPVTGYGIYSYKGAGKIYSVITTAALLFMIVFLRTRSVWVGTALGVLVFFGGIILFRKRLGIVDVHVKRLFLTFSAISVLALILIFAGKGGDYSINTLVKSISDPYSATNINRIKIWEATGDMISEKPLLGVGAGNWKLNIHRYFSMAHFDKSLLNWLRPHNDYLWVLAEKGIPGLVAFASIFVVAAIFIFKIIFSAAKPEKKILALLLASGVIAYLLVSCFTFPLERINHQVYLVIYFALISAMFSNISQKQDIKVRWQFMMMPAMIMAIFASWYSYNIILSEKQIRECRNLQNAQDWNGMYKKAQNISTTFRNIDADGTPIGWYTGLAGMKSGKNERAVHGYEQAVSEHPGHVKSMNNLGLCYINAKNNRKAIAILNRATRILPGYQEAKGNLAAAYYRNGQFYDCFKSLASLPQYLITDKLLQFKQHIKSNPGLITRQNLDSTLPAYAGNPVQKYAYYIQNDPEWLAVVKDKAESQHTSIEKAIQADAHFIAYEKEPEKYLFWNGLEYYEKLILKDPAWVEHVRQQAKQKHHDFESELEGHARAQFAKMNPVDYVLYEGAEKQKKQILADARRRLELVEYAAANKLDFDHYLDTYVHFVVGADYFEESEYDREIDGYINAMRQSDEWLRLVKSKAQKKGNPLSLELISEAKFMVMRNENGL